jgi:hypothetical protein
MFPSALPQATASCCAVVNIDQPLILIFLPELHGYLQQNRSIDILNHLYRWRIAAGSSDSMSHIPTHVAHPHGDLHTS